MLSLQQKLSTIIQYSSDNSKDKNSNNSYKEQIKIQLANLNQYISQQFLKLSAYYETKLEYQSADYQQQIGMLKQQIQRQYKVIELMKNELQDLVVMVNLQRANEREANGISQQGMKNKCIGEIDDEHKQWRVKRGQGHRMYQNDENTNNNSNIVYNNNLNTINSSQSHKASIQYQNQIASTIPQRNNTIFGLQIIAEQQTQRTLMSVCDQEQQQQMNENLQQRQNVQSERKRQKQVYEQIDQTRQIERCDDNSHQSINNDFIGQQQRKGVEGSNFQQDQQMSQSVIKSPIVFQNKSSKVFQEKSPIVFQNKQKKTNNTKSSQQHNINSVATNKYFSQQQESNKFLFSNSQQKLINKSKSKDVAVQFTNGDYDCIEDDYCSKEDKESQLQGSYLVQNQCQQLNQQMVRQNTRKHNNGRQYPQQQYPQLLFNEQKMIQSIKTNNNKKKQHKIIQKKQYNNPHFQSIRPSIYYKDKYQTNQMQNNNNLIVKNTTNNKNTITSQNIHTQKFVSNPFSKNKSSTKLKSQNHQQAQQKQQIILYKEQQRRQLSPKLFLEQFRKSFAEQRNSLQRPQQVRRSTQTRQDVMSLLQMIAMKGSAQNSKRSQRKCSSTNRDSNSNNNSRSRRKLQQQLAPSSVKNTNERKKRILTEQSSSGLRFTEQQQLSQYKQKQLLSYQKNRRSRINSKNLKGRFQTQILTHGQQQCQQPFYLNVLGKQISNLSEYQQQLQSNNYFSGEDHNFQNRNDSQFEKQIFNNNNNNYYEQFRSLQTTFGRPVSFQCLRQIKNNTNTNDIDNSCNEDGKLNHSQIQRKFSAGGIQINKNQPNKLIKYPNNQKFFKNNKENQPQRRMSEKITTSKNKPIKNSTSSFLEKKPSTKFIKNKQNINFTQQQIQQKNSSIASMLQSHLQNSNKFLVGSKKQQIKYDGQRITYGHMTLKHGHGILYYSNGLIYEGEFVQNKRHGYGLLKFNHVELYSGEWGNDQLNGKGKIRNCAIINKKKKQAGEGNTGNGQWSNVNNIFTKWISYCGQFKQNRFEGQGTLYLQGGQKFVGWFRNGVADGQGSLFKKNGQVQSGRWKNNILIEKYEMQWY